jgi:hypothetical protein
MVFIVSEKSSLHPSSLDRAVKDCISGWSVLWRHFDRQFLLKAGFADINVTAVPNKGLMFCLKGWVSLGLNVNLWHVMYGV